MTDFILGTAGKIELESITNQDAEKDVIAVVCHPHPLHGGTMNNKVVTTVYKELKRFCNVSIRFNYRGVGNSDGEYGDAEGEISDLISVITWAKNSFGNKPVYLAGFSFGAYISLRTSLIAYDVEKLLTIAPAVHHHDYRSLKDPNCNWLVVIGTADELISMGDFDDWYNSKSDKSRLIKLDEASHFFHGRLIELRDIVSEFLGE